MRIRFLHLIYLLFSNSLIAQQFVSLNLCSDRLLIELARPEQIAAMSPYSQNPLMMLDKINHSKPTVEPKLLDLLPYRDKTILLNTMFYPHLVEQLKNYGFNIFPLNDSPQTSEELFSLLKQLGEIMGNQSYAEQLITQLRIQQFSLGVTHKNTLILTETGIAYTHLPQYQTLLKLLDLVPLQNNLNEQNFSLEKMLLSQPDVLIKLADSQGYSNGTELLKHPILQKIFKNKPLATIPLKYTYCFDQGVWQGAEKIRTQLEDLDISKH